jgi:hypothetical protein
MARARTHVIYRAACNISDPEWRHEEAASELSERVLHVTF